jgi:hypothetical protein
MRAKVGQNYHQITPVVYLAPVGVGMMGRAPHLHCKYQVHTSIFGRYKLNIKNAVDSLPYMG